MLSGQGIVGKLVELLLSKIAGKKLDLLLDDRRRVCRTFAEFYFCLARLEDISTLLLTPLRDAVSSHDPSPFVIKLATVAPSLDALSQQFLDVGERLEWVVKLYDETLSRALHHLYYHKFSLLMLLSHSVELKIYPGGETTKLTYLCPSPGLLSIDMDKYYEWVKENSDRDYVEPSEIDWPIRLLETIGYNDAFARTNFHLNDHSELERFATVLETHSLILSQAKEKLRLFLVANFKIDEVFATASHFQKSGP